MSRQVYLLGFGVTLVALAFLLTDALLWRPGVTEANMRRVHKRMTLHEVERIFGGPADVESMPPIRDGGHCYAWSGKGNRIIAWVHFNLEGRVVWTFYRTWDPPSPLARLRAWLGW
jgi:hypothetical protein